MEELREVSEMLKLKSYCPLLDAKVLDIPINCFVTICVTGCCVKIKTCGTSGDFRDQFL